ncbi:MAG: hypothetical protein ACRDJ4_08605, partial [Actinomycetota bacterium]
RKTADGDVAHNFATLLGHLATLTRNRVVFEGGVGIDKLATPTPTQRRAPQLDDRPDVSGGDEFRRGRLVGHGLLDSPKNAEG